MCPWAAHHVIVCVSSISLPSCFPSTTHPSVPDSIMVRATGFLPHPFRSPPAARCCPSPSRARQTRHMAVRSTQGILVILALPKQDPPLRRLKMSPFLSTVLARQAHVRKEVPGLGIGASVGGYWCVSHQLIQCLARPIASTTGSSKYCNRHPPNIFKDRVMQPSLSSSRGLGNQVSERRWHRSQERGGNRIG